MQVSPSVRAVQVPDANPMHPDFTTIYLVGKGQTLSIDSGETMDRYRWMLKGYLAAVEKTEIALAGITHHHGDHSGNLKWVREELKAEIVTAKDAVPLLKGRLPRTGVRTFAPDTVIDLDGGIRVRVLKTPGHSTDSICYYIEEEGVLFSGDTLLGSSTTTVGDLGAYRRSLKTLLELPNLKVICPGHGPLVHDPRERLQQYIKHRDMRERQILGVLEGGGALSSWDIMLQLYPDIDKRLRRAADNNVRSHLRQLEDEGRLKVYAGKPRRPNAAKQARQEEHARVRAEVIKKARKYEDEQRRAEIRAQENPPGSEWIEPPRYELS
ncbi:MAG TPA: MBL fold metallo-hydrolase [Tepidiformaceae bacterium]|nr:MBL fold metallo-hydrolase [Tepidiformaceae bacterium]